LERILRARARVFDLQNEERSTVCPSFALSQIVEAQETTSRLGCSPYRREQEEFRSGQFSIDDPQSTQSHAQATLISIEALGSGEVWDIEVEEDHSYIAQGFVHHNSSSNPNLQNIPVRHKIIGPMLRSLFIPEKGRRWRRTDYSQIEYRLLAHYAVGEMSEEIRERYRNFPDTSFHIMVSEMVQAVTGVMMEYKPAKNLNFGLVYGMGKDKTARSLGVDFELGLKLYNAYFEALPCVKETYDSAQRLAERRGYIKTLLGRRSRFDTYEENPFRAGQMQRAGARKALNRCLQGGAADIMKTAMKDCWDEGLFKGDGCPHLTVHAELNWSDDGNEHRFRQIEEIMTNCVKLKVPMMVETETGPDWGHCTKAAKA